MARSPRPPREVRPRGSLDYVKPPRSLGELSDHLTNRGLEIPDLNRVQRYLRHIGNYRLSPYTIPFQRGQPDHVFREDTEFDNILDLYVFDRALRLLVMDALERIEVAIRAALTDHMSTVYDDSHWYTDPEHFQNRGQHAKLLEIVQKACEERLRGIRTPETICWSIDRRLSIT